MQEHPGIIFAQDGQKKMPLVEWKCQTCDTIIENIQKTTEEKPELVCPNCGHTEFEKIISKCSFHLRGSGWGKTGG